VIVGLTIGVEVSTHFPPFNQWATFDKSKSKGELGLHR
jgi:hypothetical protein